MPVPGYDPDDIDETLERWLSERELSDFLTEAELQRWNDGESILELLDDDDIRRLLQRLPEDAPAE